MKDLFFVTISLQVEAEDASEAEDTADAIVNHLIDTHMDVSDGFVADVEPA